MCYHRSYIVTKNLKVLSHPSDDHHTSIRAEHKIRDDAHVDDKNVSVEYNPITDLFDLKRWYFSFDGNPKPSWWESEHQERVYATLLKEHMRYSSMDSTYIFPGDLELEQLQNLRANSTIIAGGHVVANRLTILPPGTTIIAKRNGIKLHNVQEAYPGCVLIGDEVQIRHHPERNCTVIDYRHMKNCQYRNHYDRERDYRYQDKLDSFRAMQYSMNPASLLE